MPDVFTKRKRSKVMAQIRGGGNRDTEIALIILLRQHKIVGWRRNQHVFGKPDFVFRRQRIAVFVDGCFWHACPMHANMPESNRAFWRKKLTANKTRDRFVTRVLRKCGWRVVRIWEHELKKSPQRCMERIRESLKQNNVILKQIRKA